MDRTALATTSAWRKTLVWVGAFVAVLALYQWVLALTRIDPFAPYRNPMDNPFSGRVGVRMDNVAIRHYSRGELVGSCIVGRLDLHKDRQTVDFYQVSQGVYIGKNGRFDYETDRAMWSAGNRRLHVLSGAKVKNNDMQLVAPAFEYNQRTGNLYIDGLVQGRFFEGNVQARRLFYSVKDGSYRIGPTKWVGLAALPADETGDKPTPKRKWEFESKGTSYPADSNTMIWTDVRATDGEVIVKASRIEHKRKEDVITATGQVLYFSEKINMSCDKAIVYRKEKRAVLTGNVQMVMKPKDKQKLEVASFEPYRPVVPDEIAKTRPPAPDPKAPNKKEIEEDIRSGKSLRKYPFTILAENIEYWYAKGSRRAVITGNPQGIQDLRDGHWRYVWTNKAFYDGENEKMRMVSSPGKQDTILKNSLGDVLTADWIEFSTREDDETFTADKLRGTISSDEDEDLPKLSGESKKTDDKTGSGDRKTDDKQSGDGKGNTNGTGKADGKTELRGRLLPSGAR